MKSVRTWQSLGVMLIAAGVCAAESVAGFDSGSDGSDGDLDCAWLAKDALFDCAASCTAISPCAFEINLADANSTAGLTWDSPGGDVTGDGFGDGVYDARQWAVVYKFGTIDVPAHVTVTFANHPSGAPVVWLSEGDVTIAGEVNLDGGDGILSAFYPSFAEPGPGGFAGATQGQKDIDKGAIGYGPGSPRDWDTGGGKSATYNGSFVLQLTRCGWRAPSGTNGRKYGNDAVIPLIGGSGGGSANLFLHPTQVSVGGGAGGGAIAIGSNGTITFAQGGTIHANGGNVVNPGVRNSGPGTGGAIRLVAGDLITGPGTLRALGGCSYEGAGGVVAEPITGGGRIRLESPFLAAGLSIGPAWTWTDILADMFPEDGKPILEIVSIDDVAASTDPDAGVLTPEVELDTDVISTVHIAARNIPAGSTVVVRVVPLRGAEIIAVSTQLVDVGGGLLEATAEVTFPPGYAEVQLRSNWTP